MSHTETWDRIQNAIDIIQQEQKDHANQLYAMRLANEKYVKAAYEVRMMIEQKQYEKALAVLIPLTPTGNGS